MFLNKLFIGHWCFFLIYEINIRDLLAAISGLYFIITDFVGFLLFKMEVL